MSRYIDADKLLNLMDNEVVDSDEMTEYADKYKEDVLPVIHAKWVSSKIPGSILSECSHCNFDCGSYSYEYCPYCGARMDGEENESS